MDDFSVHAARLSAEADTRLGDSILYATGPGENYLAMKGRIFASEATSPIRGFQRLDEMRGGWRLRIAKDLVPLPSKDDRIKCEAVLGGDVFRPMAKDPISDGRYWLVDIQKV